MDGLRQGRIGRRYLPLHGGLRPRGYADCVNDPAYILFYHPTYYKEIFGDKTPLEVLWIENGCMESYEKDPEMKYYCYDDEDK